MFPLKNRLTYIWALATGKDIQYSPVYSKHGYDSVWAEIEPIQGQKDLYTIHRCHATLNTAWDAEPFLKFMAGPKWKRERVRYTEGGTGKSSFSLAKANSVLEKLAKRWERDKYTIDKNQYFAHKLLKSPAPRQ